MDVFDKFFIKYSYKFPKGYPDMNDAQDVLLMETLVSEIIGKDFKIINEGKGDRDVRDIIINTNPGYFDTQTDDRRIANKKKISAEEFQSIIKNTFKKLIPQIALLKF